MSGDAEAYAQDLSRRAPAGSTVQQRAGAERRAAVAERRAAGPRPARPGKAGGAAGDARPEHWLALGQATLGRSQPDPNRARRAGWHAVITVPAGAPEAPAPLLIADALERPAQQLQALEAAVARAPDDPRWRTALAVRAAAAVSGAAEALDRLRLAFPPPGAVLDAEGAAVAAEVKVKVR